MKVRRRRKQNNGFFRLPPRTRHIPYHVMDAMWDSDIIMTFVWTFFDIRLPLYLNMASSSRKSARLSEKAETVIQLRCRGQLSENKKASATEKTTKKAQGRNSKKQKTSNGKNASNANNAIPDQSNRSRIKGKEENSKFMKDIPFDVLLEIFSLLHPGDLLHLSRVSTSLHDLLTSKSLICLWKSVCLLPFFFES